MRKSGKKSQWCMAAAVPEGTTFLEQRNEPRKKQDGVWEAPIAPSKTKKEASPLIDHRFTPAALF